MINDNELLISNKSYINKDFASIYSELMDIAKKISSKYDPETSNESDPFIVLMKLLAFIGDKLNYNIDKNVLERFMPSATQENTMRDLTSMLGYNMSYYIAPSTKIYVKYVGNEKFTDTHKTFTLPKLSTIFTDSDGDTQFILTENCVIEGYNVTQLKGSTVMQGTVNTLTVLNNDVESELILLENLDENNRIYFPLKKVAQNGVFISGGTATSSSTIDGYWTRVDNLNTQQLNSYVYQFGYDSNEGLPYVEFPDDIANLIGDGLSIKYIVTDGASGNISVGKLTTLKSPTSVNWDNSEDTITLTSDDDSTSPLVINNTVGTINGADPESIDEAYSNYKKIIGTFDTLVTCRDYANAIYNLLDSEELYNIVSNVQVTDRRTDYNNATNIITYSKYGKEYVNTVDNDSTITAYDLVLYPLRAIKTYSVDTFKDSFKPMTKSYRTYVEGELEDSKCLSHDYKYPSLNDVYAVKNYYKLKAFITTNSKVTSTEAASVLSNINKALIENFNARKVDYGYEIPYDTLLSTIENSDERIKAVSLYEPDIETKFMLSDSNNTEVSLFSTSAKDSFITLVAKNVMSGRISLFNYYDKFSFDFGDTQTQGWLNGSSTKSYLPLIVDNIESVTTDAGIVIPTSDDGYTLKENEVIQIVSPSLVTHTTYPYGINYYLYLSDGSTMIKQGVEYELKSGDLCVFEYTNSNDEQVVDVYQHEDTPIIIKPNFDMYTTSYRVTPRDGYSKGETPITKVISNMSTRTLILSIKSDVLDSEGRIKLFTLTTNDQVEYRTVNEVSMYSTSYCAWIMNNDDNEIRWNSSNEYMLKDGEYFFQTDLGYNNLLSYGSGTVLKKTGFNSFTWKAKAIDVTVLDSDGLLGHSEFFVKITISSTDTMKFLEQSIVTLTENDAIKADEEIDLSDNVVVNVNNKGIQYKLSSDDSWNYLSTLSYTGSTYNYQNANAILDINCGPELPQVLLGNQSMTFKTVDGSTVTSVKVKHDSDTNPIIKLERLHQISGGSDISLVSVNINDVTTKLYDSVCLYEINSDNSNANKSDDFDVLQLDEDTKEKTYSIPMAADSCVTMMYVDIDDETKLEDIVTITPTNCTVENLSDDDATITSLHRGINNLKITFTGDNATIKLTLDTSKSTKASITIRLPRYLDNDDMYNSDELGLTKFHEEVGTSLTSLQNSLRDKIKTLDANSDEADNGFYYCCDIDNSKAIEYDDLSSPYAFYDSNNVINKMVISEIDFSDSQPDIAITRGSMIK